MLFRFIGSFCVAAILFAVPFEVKASDLRTFNCTYTTYSDKEGNHPTSMKLTFVWDVTSNKSYMLGDQGQTRVSTLSAQYRVFFVEIAAGNQDIITTAINLNPSSGYESVHSRSSSTGRSMQDKNERFKPSQFYGTCTLVGYNPLTE